jgi:hypothetical protein
MAKYPTIEHVLVRDLAEGDALVALQTGNPPNYTALPAMFALVIGGDDTDIVTVTRVVSVDIVRVESDGWHATVEVQQWNTRDGPGGTVQGLSANPLDLATVVVGDLGRLLP